MINYFVDEISAYGARGWAFSSDRQPVRVEAWAGETSIGATTTSVPRPDVAKAHDAGPRSGFDFTFAALTGPSSTTEVRLLFFVGDEPRAAVGRREATPVHFLTEAGYRAIRTNSECGRVSSSFRASVTRIVEALWGPERSGIAADRHNTVIAEKVALLASQPYRAELQCVTEYVRFLRETWAHFQFVKHYFPAVDPSRLPSDKDNRCTPNSPEELLSIANHLYVLRSHGLGGAFAEFGCFKGYSTSMLSYACRLLGIRVHVFDSFSGLPPSASDGYAKGEFCGSISEVDEHVRTFGAREVVSFHKGYFCDTVPHFAERELISLWMDVDLESSAKDLLTVANRIHPAGAIFSHECEPTAFVELSAVQRHPNAVIPPIRDAIEELGGEVSGCYLAGCTGSFWRRGRGIPVLANSILLRLLSAIR
jgi:O-methyltransferase